MKTAKFNKICFFVLIWIITFWGFQSTVTGQFPIAEADKFINQGDNLFKTGNFQNALEIYSNAVEVAPNYAMGYMKRAVVYRTQGEEVLAQRDYRKAMALNPYSEYIFDSRAKMKILATDYIKFPKPEQNYYHIEEGLTLIYDGFMDTHFGIEYYLNYINNSTNYENMNDLEFRNFLITGIDELIVQAYDNALTEFQNSILVNDKFSASYDLRGLALAGTGNIEQAIESFDSAIQLNENLSIPYYNRSMMYRISGKPKKALEDINVAINLDRNNKYYYLARATLHKELDDFNSTIDDYNRILKLDPSFVEAYIYRALTYMFLGNLTHAAMDINDALKLDPDNPRIWNIKGNIHMFYEDYDLAIQDYNFAIKLDVNYSNAYHNRGLARIMKLSKDSGCDDLRKAESLGHIESGYKLEYFCIK